MSVQYINETISGLGLIQPKVFYDFDSFSGNYINSIADGDSLYSGEVVNYSSSFTGQNSGSGFFNGQHIAIENHTGITSENFTILFSQEKTGKEPGVIFSTLDPNGPSGCEIGINGANNLYYKNFVNGTPNYKTLLCYPSDKNIYAASVSSFGVVELRHFSFGIEKETPFVYQFENSSPAIKYYGFNKDDIDVPVHSISNGSKMHIGSGEFSYRGYMDYFLYFDEVLNNDTLSRLSRGIYGDITITPPVTGRTLGTITGYAVTSTDQSGIVGTEVYSTGTWGDSGQYTWESGTPLTGSVGISGVVYVPYTGVEANTGIKNPQLINQTIYKEVVNLKTSFSLSGSPEKTGLSNYESSGDYWYFSGNSGTYNGSSAVGPVDTIFGITGFRFDTLTGYVTGLTGDLLGFSGNSGTSYTGFSYSGLRSSGIIYTGTGQTVSFGSDTNDSYFPRALSMIGPANENYFYEILYDLSGANGLSREANIAENYTYEIYVASRTGDAGNAQSQAAMNGVSLFTGSATYSKNAFNFPLVSIDTGYMTSGADLFTNIELEPSDVVLYDTVPSGEKQSLLITSTGQYASAPFSEITIANNNIFFNGVKLNSGIEFVDNGGFYPTGNITGATGLYFTYPEYTGQQSVTGSGIEPITVVGVGLTPHGYTSFYNGIRQPLGGIIEHGMVSDLRSGTITLNNQQTVYTMSNGVEVIS